MKRLFLCLAVMVMVFSFANVCFAKAEFHMRAAIDQPKSLSGGVAFQRFKELVEKRSNGRINVEVFFDGTLGNAREEIEGVQLGTIQMTQAANSAFTAWVPEMNIFELPFLFKDPKHLSAVLDSDIALGFRPQMAKNGFHLLGFNTVGLRHLMTKEKVINSITDLKGLKIRTMENPVHLDSFEAFGASPLPMAYGELYTSLETGAIDGAEAANSNYYAKKFYEVAPNWGMIGWLYMVAPMIMNKAFYDSLPGDLQMIVNKAGMEVCKLGRDHYMKLDKEKFKLLQKQNVKVTTPDRKPFMKASEKVYEQWASKVGGRKKIDAIINFKY